MATLQYRFNHFISLSEKWGMLNYTVEALRSKARKDFEQWNELLRILTAEYKEYQKFGGKMFAIDLVESPSNRLHVPLSLGHDESYQQMLGERIGFYRMDLSMKLISEMVVLVDALRKKVDQFEKRKATRLSFLELLNTSLPDQPSFKKAVRELCEVNGRLIMILLYYEPPPPEEQQIALLPGLYQPLDFDQHEIRLLLVEWHEDETSPIICSMQHASLLEPGPYIALSYRWGDPSSTTKLAVKSSANSLIYKLDITLNLDFALRSLRKHLKGSSSGLSLVSALRVWVDAICINQKDGQERSLQVQNMRQVYSGAVEVVACVELVKDVMIDEKAEMDFNLAATTIPTQVLGDTHVPVSETILLAASKIAVIFRSLYWMRVWIIQELTVASKARIIYGDRIFQWSQLVRVLTVLDRESTATASQVATTLPSHLVKFYQRYANQVREPITLMEALSWSRRALSTDPRDKLFALLGLCHDASMYVPLLNYKQPLGLILSEMTRKMMLLNKSLDYMLVKGISPYQSPNKENVADITPSWVSDWPGLWSGPTILPLENLLTNNNVVQSEIWIHTFMVPFKGSKLGCRGGYLGTIESMTSPMLPDCESAVMTMHQPSLQTNVERAFCESSPTEDSSAFTIEPHLPDLFVRTMITVAEVVNSGTSLDFMLPIIRLKWFASVWSPDQLTSSKSTSASWLRENSNFVLVNKSVSRWAEELSNYIDSDGNEDNMKEAHDSMDKLVLKSRMRFVVLKQRGKSEQWWNFAMVHPNAEIGDDVYWIDGCSTPVVLRKRSQEPENKDHSVIGSAYVGPEFSFDERDKVRRNYPWRAKVFDDGIDLI